VETIDRCAITPPNVPRRRSVRLFPYEAALCETHAAQINSGAEYLWNPAEQIVKGDDPTGLHEYVVLDVLDSTESIRLVSNPDEDGKRLKVKVRRRGGAIPTR